MTRDELTPRPGREAPSRRRQIASWCLFDFANSSFTTVIVTVVFAAYFDGVIAGDSVDGSRMWSVALAISNLVIVFTAPIVGAMADSSRKKTPLFVSYVLCCLCTAGLFFTGEGAWLPAMMLFVLANIAFATGENLIAGFLPDLADGRAMAKISAYGWATGYVGGLIALLICLALAKTKDDTFIRATNLVVAVFFAVGGLPTFLYIREKRRRSSTPKLSVVAHDGLRRLRSTWRDRNRHRQLFRFLLAYLFFNIGIYGVIGFAGIFAQRLFGMSQEETIQMFIATQVIAALGAMVTAPVAARIGGVRTVGATLIVWIVGGSLALIVRDKAGFYIVAFLAGFGIGSTLPASRAVIGNFAPKGRGAEFFGFWGVCARAAAALSPAGNFLAIGLTKSLGYSRDVQLRSGIAWFVLSFVIGLVLLLRVDEEAGIAEARAAEST